MNIQEELGLTNRQFEKLKEQVLLDLLKSHKPKNYRKMACPNCKGSGQVVEKTLNYCVYERLQDEDLGCVDVFNDLKEAEEYVEERTAQPLGACSMFTIVAPDGEIIG